MSWCARPRISGSRSIRLRNTAIPLPGGRTVPLSQFATFEYEQEYPLVWRRDRVPTLTVHADLRPGVLPDTVVAALAPEIAAFSKSLPAGYRLDVGGTVEESAKSQASVVAVVPAMLLIMLTVLIFQLRSFQKLFIVLSVGPLGLIGVVLALLAFNRPLGFVAILGILALLGMITKNAVILIGQIDAEREAGKDVMTAVVDASSARFRPIMLTAISTVLGMIPIAPTVFWGPMAFAIMGGLLVATILTLIFLPTLYVTWFSLTEKKSRKAGGDAGMIGFAKQRSMRRLVSVLVMSATAAALVTFSAIGGDARSRDAASAGPAAGRAALAVAAPGGSGRGTRIALASMCRDTGRGIRAEANIRGCPAAGSATIRITRLWALALSFAMANGLSVRPAE